MTEYHRFSHDAMATTFEVIIAQGDVDALYTAQAAQAVFAEIDRLEDELSRFRPGSDVARLNQLRAGECVSVSLAAWDCLSLAKTVHEETGGAFDITIGPLMHLWRNAEGNLVEPEAERLALARDSVGSQLFELCEEGFLVRVLADHMIFDLGAVGKGYALDQAVQVLQDWSITRAFLNAGDSTLLALESPEGEETWAVTLADESQERKLKDRALSGSGFMVKGAHIMNPRTLTPVPIQGKRSYALAPTAALSDALSTAFMVMSPDEIRTLCERCPEVEWLEI